MSRLRITHRPRRGDSPWALLFVGGLFALVGLVFVGVALSTSREAARISGLPVVSAVELEDMPPGRAVLIEGRIDQRARPRFRSFVVYVRDEYRGNDSDGDPKWQEDERVTPRLLLDLPDGRAEIVNEDYRVEQESAVWLESNALYWNSTTDEGTKRYQGFQAGDTVLVVGVATAGVEFPGVNAELLAGGTRESYLAEQRVLQLVMSIVGGLMTVLGLALLAFGLRVRRRRWR